MPSHPQLIHHLCTQGYHLIDGFLNKEQCQALREAAQEYYQQGLFRGARIGRTVDLQQNKFIRTDEILWLEGTENNPAIQAFIEAMQRLAAFLNESLFLGLYEFETHFASYQPGTYYKKHCDQFASQKTRKISFVYYLNPNWREEYGGELVLYNKEEQLLQKVLPVENRLLCFNSELPHEVCLTHQPRYSITGWMKTRPKSLI